MSLLLGKKSKSKKISITASITTEQFVRLNELMEITNYNRSAVIGHMIDAIYAEYKKEGHLEKN